MKDFEDDDEDKEINEDMSKFNELGLMRDIDFVNQNYLQDSDKGKFNSNKTVLNASLKIPNKLSANLREDSQEELDENNDNRT